MAGERVATYEYDGLFRRIEKAIGNQGTGIVNGSDAGGVTGVQAGDRHEHYFYAGWRLIETTDHAEDGGDYSYGDADVLGQFVYGTTYIDEPLVYDRNLDADTDPDCLEGADARYFYHQDANYRVVMLTDESGDVAERTRYTAYGEPTLFGGADGNGNEVGNAMLVSSVGNPLLHQGLFRDSETLTYQNRFRQYDGKSGRFFQRDPLEYLSGANLYDYTRSAPTSLTDPLGLVPPGHWDPTLDLWIDTHPYTYPYIDPPMPLWGYPIEWWTGEPYPVAPRPGIQVAVGKTVATTLRYIVLNPRFWLWQNRQDWQFFFDILGYISQMRLSLSFRDAHPSFK